MSFINNPDGSVNVIQRREWNWKIPSDGSAPPPPDFFVVYEASDASPGTSTANTDLERADFLSVVIPQVETQAQGFEVFSNPMFLTGPIVMAPSEWQVPEGTLTAIIDALPIGATINNNNSGRFNTTPGGDQFLQLANGSTCTFDFDIPISVFACYLTDLGDFGGGLNMILREAGTGTLTVVPFTPIAAVNGSLSFFGVVSSKLYDQVSLQVTGTGGDYIGVDDVMVTTYAGIIQ